MKTATKIVLLMVLTASFSLTACTRKSRWDELNHEILVLYQEGDYQKAAPLAEEALTYAEDTFGPNNPKVAGALDTLALIYYSQGKYEQAEPLYQQELTILETALGPNHPDVAVVLETMAEFYRKIGKNEKAESLSDRVKTIRSGQQPE